MCLLGSPELDTALQMGLTSVEWRGWITTLPLLVMLIPIQPRVLLSLLCHKSALLGHAQLVHQPHLWLVDKLSKTPTFFQVPT